MNRRILIHVLAGLSLAGCGNAAPFDPADALVLTEVTGADRTLADDPAEIVDAWIADDRLHLEVRYGGGCREHTFALIQSDVFRESYPVQTDLRLAHDAAEDPCRAIVSRMLTFDLEPLRSLYQRSYSTRSGSLRLFLLPPGQRNRSIELLYEF